MLRERFRERIPLFLGMDEVVLDRNIDERAAFGVA